MQSLLKKTFINMATGEIYHIKAPDKMGRSQHIFLKVNSLKKPQLDRLLAEGALNVDFSEYGSVIASCYGMFPTADVRTRMKEEYNFDC